MERTHFREAEYMLVRDLHGLGYSRDAIVRWVQWACRHEWASVKFGLFYLRAFSVEAVEDQTRAVLRGPIAQKRRQVQSTQKMSIYFERRHLVHLAERAEKECITIAEAVRRYLDEALALSPGRRRAKKPTKR